MKTVRFSTMCKFTDAQWRATQEADSHSYTLFGGSRGPGKSYWLRWYLLRELITLAGGGIKNAVVGLFCEDYPSLTDRQVTKISNEFPPWLGELKESKIGGFGFHLKPRFGGGILALRNLDDASKYQSAEFADIGVDELTKNSLETFNQLRGSLRWPGVKKPRFQGVTNPGGIGHAFVKGYWIDRVFPPEMVTIASEFAFVPALPSDNPHLSESYWSMLNTLPEQLRKAWREGLWDAFEGQFFALDQVKEIVQPFEIPSGWELLCGLDPGYSSPCAGVLMARDYAGIYYIISTYYVPGRNPQANAAGVKEWLTSSHWTGGRIPRIISGLDAWAKKDKYAVVANDVTFADVFRDEGLYLDRAKTDRKMGWWVVKSLIPDRLKIFAGVNKTLVNEMVPVLADELDPEDISGRGNDPKVMDHALDALRYACMATYKPTEMPKPEEEWVEKWRKEEVQTQGWSAGLG